MQTYCLYSDLNSHFTAHVTARVSISAIAPRFWRAFAIRCRGGGCQGGPPSRKTRWQTLQLAAEISFTRVVKYLLTSLLIMPLSSSRDLWHLWLRFISNFFPFYAGMTDKWEYFRGINARAETSEEVMAPGKRNGFSLVSCEKVNQIIIWHILHLHVIELHKPNLLSYALTFPRGLPFPRWRAEHRRNLHNFPFFFFG